MATHPLLSSLAATLAGEFDNKAQSMADPTWFLHLRVWNRPLPKTVFADGYGFFIEQISVASGAAPYRQRILHLTAKGDGLWGQYYGLKDPQVWQGSATQPDRLADLTGNDLIDLPTCGLAITWDSASAQYIARLPENSLCRITYQGQDSYISLGFDLAPAGPGGTPKLSVYDHGVDPTTGKMTWGPRMGPFQLQRQAVYGVDSLD